MEILSSEEGRIRTRVGGSQRAVHTRFLQLSNPKGEPETCYLTAYHPFGQQVSIQKKKKKNDRELNADEIKLLAD